MCGGALEMQELTRVMIGCSMLSIGIGGKRKFADSGEPPRKGMMKFWGLQPLRLDSFLQYDLQAPALLPVYSTDSGMASINSGDKNSSEMLQLHGEDREGQRELGSDWKSGETLGFHCGSSGGFYRAGVVGIDDPTAATVGMRRWLRLRPMHESLR
jgi:hypothetical protein